jgi:hypothetical protein
LSSSAPASKNSKSEHKETWMTLAGDLASVADQKYWFLKSIITVSSNKMCAERTTIRERSGNQWNIDKRNDRGIGKFSRMLPKDIGTFAKACRYLAELLWSNNWVRERKITHFCLMYQ